jgi:heptosyltransferase-1
MSAMKPESLLLVRLSSMGDIACALPLAAWLAGRGVRVGQVVEGRFARLLELVSFPLERHVWRRGLRGRSALRGIGACYDAVLDLQGNWKSGFVSSGLDARRLVGLAARDVRERGNLLLIDEQAAPSRGTHVLERSAAVLEYLLGEAVPMTELADLTRHGLLRAPDGVLERMLRQVPESVRYVLVLGRPSDPRSIPLHLLEELARELGEEALLLAGPGERELRPSPGLPLLRQLGAVDELVALGEIVRQRGGAVLGHDSGAMHVLRASAAPTRFVFGPQDPARTGPSGEEVLRARIELDCRPCLSRRCEHPQGPRCMEALELDALRSFVLGPDMLLPPSG